MTDLTAVEQAVLRTEGLTHWIIVDAQDGYCWYQQKKIQRIRGDFSLFLHEVAHALCESLLDDPLWNQDKTGHHARWADTYTRLVRIYMVNIDALVEARQEATIEEQAKWHQAGYDDGRRKAWEDAIKEAEFVKLVRADNESMDVGFICCKNSILANLRRRSRAHDAE